MSDYNAYANQKFLDEYYEKRSEAKPDEEKRKKLEAHIAQFPSSLDDTSIGKQLRDHGVDVRLYAEIRDSLWRNYQKVKDRKAKLEGLLLQIRNEIHEEL